MLFLDIHAHSVFVKKVVGIEKIVPTIHDALIIAEVIWGYAKYTMPSYISIIAGPFAYLST